MGSCQRLNKRVADAERARPLNNPLAQLRLTVTTDTSIEPVSAQSAEQSLQCLQDALPRKHALLFHSPAVANKVFLGLTTILRCQHVGDPEVNNPKLAIRNEQSKRARKSEIIGGGDSPPLSLA
jgi:hypothetical protein